MIALWLWMGLAFGAGYYLEAPPVNGRAAAVELQTDAQALGYEARVMRRYRHGSGWEFVVVVEGFGDREAAELAAGRLAESSGQGIAVYRLEASEIAVPGGDPPPEAPPVAGLPDAAVLLQRAARSLGGVQGGQARLHGTSSLRFRYSRALMTPEATLTADHDWIAQGEARRVGIDVVDGGAGTSSVIGMGGPDDAWVAVGGEIRDALPGPTGALLLDLSPLARLAWPLQFASSLEDLGAYRVARQEDVAGRSCWALIAIVPEPHQPARIWLDVEHGRPARVDFATEAGRVELTLADWREPDTGVVVPYLVELRRDGLLVERVEVAELTLGLALPDDAFLRPGTD